MILPDAALRERWDVFAADVRHDANVIGTVGAIAAYERGDAWQREVKDLIRSNVDLVERALASTPIDFVRPEGTYLTWWGFESVDLGTLSPAATLRERARIAANDGRTLGADYASWARINLACAPRRRVEDRGACPRPPLIFSRTIRGRGRERWTPPPGHGLVLSLCVQAVRAASMPATTV